MSNSNGNSGFWLIVGGVLFFAFLMNLFSSNSSSSVPVSPSPSTPEYRYVRERFRQEGFNSEDSKTAADAVMKFHEAQKNRAR